MKNSNQNLVTLVDENNNDKGNMDKMEAHKRGELHRAISVFIFNTKGEWLLQRRAFGKHHSNGLWTNACCSHPIPGESAFEAANRRLMEEMGMKAQLKEIFTFTYKTEVDNNLIEHELDHVFLGITDDTPEINLQEVQDWRYINYPELCNEVDKNPDAFTVWFKMIFNKLNRHTSGVVSK